MTSVAPKHSGSQKPQRDPNAVGIMSFLLPGLGQFANGDQRKGTFFLVVGLINYGALTMLILAQQIINQVNVIGASYNMKPNMELTASFNSMGLGSPVGVLLALLFASFSVFCARDAYEKAAHVKRQAIYHDYVLEMPEATSGSYFLHAFFLFTCELKLFL